MSYNSQQSQNKHIKHDIFKYVRWSMEETMSSEDNVIKHYNRFLDLADPLLDSYHLKDEECDTLFWYGFHPEDHAMILDWFHPQQTRTYLHLKQVFCTACAIFSQ